MSENNEELSQIISTFWDISKICKNNLWRNTNCFLKFHACTKNEFKSEFPNFTYAVGICFFLLGLAWIYNFIGTKHTWLYSAIKVDWWAGNLNFKFLAWTIKNDKFLLSQKNVQLCHENVMVRNYDLVIIL